MERIIIDKKVMKRSVIILIALIIPFNAIHEIGHLIPCLYSGGQGSFTIGIIAAQASCSILEGSLVFAFSGGLLATLVALVPLTIKRIVKYPSITIVLGSLAIGNFMVAILETFAREWYMSDIAVPVVSFTTFTTYIVMLVLFGRQNKLRKDRWLTSAKANKILEKEKFG